MASYPHLSPADQSTYLRKLIDRVAALRVANARPVIAFDLDGTLMDNRPRSVAIFKQLSVEWSSRFPAASALLSDAAVDHLAYSVSDSLARLGVTEPAHVAEASTFWSERFFRDPHIAHDIEVPGAASFASALYDAGATLVFLTGRDLPNMSLGSWASLRDLGFPIGRVGTELVCKPEFDIPDETYKRDVAPTLARLGQLAAAFDNEPANCNVFLRTFPESASVLLDTQHASGAPPLDPGVVCIRDFLL